MNRIDELTKALVESTEVRDKRKTSGYDTTARVIKVEGNTAWVAIPGGVEKTPASMAVAAKAGDETRVRIAGGKAYIVGNVTSPPTDDTYAKKAEDQAIRAARAADAASEQAGRAERAAGSAVKDAATARESAVKAVEDADIARTSAESAQADAEASAQILDEMREAAEDAGTTLTDIYSDAETSKDLLDQMSEAAQDADTTLTRIYSDAAVAKTNAEQATTYANSALKGLGQVEDVVGVLDWLTAHSALTEDTVPQAGKQYYIKNADDTFTLVTNVEGKNPSEEGWYELTEAVQNYILSHLALTNTGLHVMADNSKWKVRIANDGVYIVDPQGNEVAKYKDAITLGIDDGTQSFIKEDYHSLQMIDKEGNTYFHVSDLRGADGTATLTDVFYGDGETKIFILGVRAASTSYEVSVSDSSGGNIVKETERVLFETAPNNGAKITVVYDTNSFFAKAYTLGQRRGVVGAFSYAEGYGAVSSGFLSHAEGYNANAEGPYSHAEGLATHATGHTSHAEGWRTRATGIYSHAEGYNTNAEGPYSHASGEFTTASGRSQTVIGKYNEDTPEKAFVIGNGSFINNRSNALEVGWDGDIVMALDDTAASGTEKALYDAITALGWTDVLV